MARFADGAAMSAACQTEEKAISTLKDMAHLEDDVPVELWDVIARMMRQGRVKFTSGRWTIISTTCGEPAACGASHPVLGASALAAL